MTVSMNAGMTVSMNPGMMVFIDAGMMVPVGAGMKALIIAGVTVFISPGMADSLSQRRLVTPKIRASHKKSLRHPNLNSVIQTLIPSPKP